jgi:hypothetical protein
MKCPRCTWLFQLYVGIEGESVAHGEKKSLVGAFLFMGAVVEKSFI